MLPKELFPMDRADGIEPTLVESKATVLPLDDTRITALNDGIEPPTLVYETSVLPLN